MAHQFLQLEDYPEKQNLLSYLNTNEKGSDVLILHLGSHSVKFGLSTQSQPFIAPNVIAYPTKNGQKVCTEMNQELEEQRQFMFDTQVEKVLPEIEHALRKKRFLLIDAKSAKNIRNKQVSYKIFDESNVISRNIEPDEPFKSSEISHMNTELLGSMEGFNFINGNETQNPNTQLRPFLVGKEALALHKSEEYTLKYPIKYGDLNVSQSYSYHQCCNDLQNILETLLFQYMRLPKKNFEHFNVILIIPDMFVKHHLRYIVQMILGKMKFKSIFMHTESVMATFAMALPTACVVDVGSSKINVCCIDEGLLVPKSIIRKHYGGDEINEVLYRFINRNKALHYFPKNLLNMDYHYHQMLIEQLKEQFAISQMDQGEIVKTCILYIKEKGDKKRRECQQVTFNCSDSLLYAPQSIFYSSLIGIMKRVKLETSDPVHRDPLMVAEGFQDPEDVMNDIIQGINAQSQANQNQGLKQSMLAKPEETPGNTPSVSLQQDMQSELCDEDLQGEKIVSEYQKMQDHMDLDEMICRSICSMENPEVRKKLANSIILVGGTTKIKKFIDSLEEAVMDRFSTQFDETVERVNVEQFNIQQIQQYHQQHLLLQAAGQAVGDPNPESLRIDPRFVSWMGASIIPKLESSKDMFISRDKFLLDFRPYKENFQEQKLIQIQQTLEQLKAENQNLPQEESKKGTEDVIMNDQSKVNPEETGLNPQQIEQIEKEVGRKLKKERNLEAGVKQLREKVPFHF